MKIITVELLFVFLFCNITEVTAQDNSLYNRGIASLSERDTISAESYFKLSISQNRDAPSFYELANIQVKENTFESRNLALDNYKQAVLRDPENIEYRVTLVKIKFEMSYLFGLAELDELNPDNIKSVESMVKIADMYEELFENYLHLHMDANPLYEPDQNFMFELKNFRDYAGKFFKSAETFYLKALSRDIYYEKAVLGYARLNAFNGAYGRAIYYLDMLYQKKPDIKDLNLYLGMYYFKIKDFPASAKHFTKALSLMNEEESQVYTYATVIAFMDPDVKRKLVNLPMEEQKKRIKKFWESRDPFFLSAENERLDEHYYRVAYSNYFFGVKRLSIPGWQTDRGKVFISFGDPKLSFIGCTPKTAQTRDTWYYDDRVLRFDSKMYDNYKLDWKSDFVGMRIPPVPRIETSADIYDRQKYDRFSVSELKSPYRYLNPLALNVFRSFNNPAENEIYFTYMLPMPFNTVKEEHEYGLFFLNKEGDFILKKTGIMTKKILDSIAKEGRPNYQYVNTIKANAKPGDIRYSFETKTLRKENVSSLQRDFRIAKFKKDSLDLSGIVIASKVEEGTEISGAVKRNDIYIIPKIGSQFESKEPIYIYYEVYNLNKRNNDLTDFEQTIVIRESDPVETGIPLLKMFRSIAEMISDSKNRLSLSSSFKTKETNSQIYQQLDFRVYKPGKYDLFIIVEDKTTGQKTERKCLFEITGTNTAE
jgi:GWxTD domain-containing protein